MNTVMAKIQRFGRFRKLHTIISKETIKPSSPTPPHLKIHNLSIIDNLSPNLHVPWILFYETFNNRDINILKKSLSQSLTQYYPFAGRLLAPDAPHINCNDEGVEFLEASIHSPLDDFILENDQDETLDQLIPNALGCVINKTNPHMVAVQLSYFTCGGVAVAVSISHKVADGFTMVNFINHWATLTRGGSPIKLCFFSSSLLGHSFKIPEFPLVETPKVKYTIRRFMFPNSKLIKLKNKINVMGTTRLNPTRVESLTSLLFKCAATTKSGSLQPSSLNQSVNLRGKTNANFPQIAAGNFYGLAVAKIKDSGKTKLNEVITSLRNERMQLQGAREVNVGKKMVHAIMTLLDDQIQTYAFSSLCGFPFYQVDFGWGKPTRVILRRGNFDANFIVLMDTPSGDGIEATVRLKEEDMIIFEKNKELHAYTYEDMKI